MRLPWTATDNICRARSRRCCSGDRATGGIVIGVRRRGDQQVAGINLFGNRFANLCVQRAAGVPLPGYAVGIPRLSHRDHAASPRARHAFRIRVDLDHFRGTRAVPIHSLPVDVYYPPVGASQPLPQGRGYTPHHTRSGAFAPASLGHRIATFVADRAGAIGPQSGVYTGGRRGIRLAALPGWRACTSG